MRGRGGVAKGGRGSGKHQKCVTYHLNGPLLHFICVFEVTNLLKATKVSFFQMQSDGVNQCVNVMFARFVENILIIQISNAQVYYLQGCMRSFNHNHYQF